jgi:hypothetical protein
MNQSNEPVKLQYSTPLFERYGKVSDLTQALNTNKHSDGINSNPNSANNRTH